MVRNLRGGWKIFWGEEEDGSVLKIAFVSHSAEVGGAELVLLELVQGLTRAGVASCEVVFPVAGPIVDRFRGLGVGVHVAWYPQWAVRRRLGRARFAVLVRGCLAAIRLAVLFRRLGADVVVSNSVTHFSGAVAAWLVGLPHLWYVHEYILAGDEREFLWRRQWSFRVVSWLSRAVCVPSVRFARYLTGFVAAEKIRVVRYAAETRLRRGRFAVGGPWRVAVVGRKCVWKNQEDAVRAVSLLHRRGRVVELLLIGPEDATYAGYLKRLVMELGIERAVRFVGFAEDPFVLMVGRCVVVSCSAREVLPRVVVEGMKLGYPVIAARCSGTEELIVDGVTGILYHAGNAEELAEAMESVLGDTRVAVRLSRNARRWARQFCRREFVQQFLAVVGEVAGIEEEEVRSQVVLGTSKPRAARGASPG
jgi:glycosyltransferase involved in cell wall biosynthesis